MITKLYFRDNYLIISSNSFFYQHPVVYVSFELIGQNSDVFTFSNREFQQYVSVNFADIVDESNNPYVREDLLDLLYSRTGSSSGGSNSNALDNETLSNYAPGFRVEHTLDGKYLMVRRFDFIDSVEEFAYPSGDVTYLPNKTNAQIIHLFDQFGNSFIQVHANDAWGTRPNFLGVQPYGIVETYTSILRLLTKFDNTDLNDSVLIQTTLFDTPGEFLQPTLALGRDVSFKFIGTGGEFNDVPMSDGETVVISNKRSFTIRGVMKVPTSVGGKIYVTTFREQKILS